MRRKESPSSVAVVKGDPVSAYTFNLVLRSSVFVLELRVLSWFKLRW